MPESPSSRQIAALNDAFRTSFMGGLVVLTSGIQALTNEIQVKILLAVRAFDEFSLTNDPYCEHDFGSLMVQAYKVFWKIDYYDLEMQYHSENAADSSVTQRVLTVMLAEDY